MVNQSIDNTILGRETHVVRWNWVFSPCRVLKIWKLFVHSDWISKTIAVKQNRKDGLGLWIFKDLESLEVENHWYRRSVYVFWPPPKLHIWFHAE